MIQQHQINKTVQVTENIVIKLNNHGDIVYFGYSIIMYGNYIVFFC